MKDLPENELFSAYLDGELTAAEQAEVEQLLADNPAARQLLDELRALSSTLQSMPQYALGEDLSDRVLRMAERRMLTDSERLSRPRGNGKTWPSHLSRLLNARALIWSGLAVAIAVMFMLSQPPKEDGGGMALAPGTAEGEAERDRGNAGAEIRAVGGEEDLAARRGGILPLDKKAEIIEGEGIAAGMGIRPPEKDSPDGSPHLATKPGITPDDPHGPADYVSGKTPAPTTFEMKKPGEEPPGPTWPQIAQVQQPAGPLPVPGPGGRGGAGAHDQDTVGLRTNDNGLRLPGKGAGAFEEGGVSLETRLSGLVTMHGAQAVGEAISGFASRLEPIDSAYTVVCLDVRSAAVADRTFDQTLGKNKILPATREKLSEEDPAGPGSTDLRPQRLDATQQVKIIEGMLEDLTHHGELALFYVEATPEQIQATVAELTEQPEQFPSVQQLQLASLARGRSIQAVPERHLDRYDDSAERQKKIAETGTTSGREQAGRAGGNASGQTTGVADGVLDEAHERKPHERKHGAAKDRQDLPAGYVWRLPIPGRFAKAGGREDRDAAEFFDMPTPEGPSSGTAAGRGGQVAPQPVPSQSAPLQLVPSPAVPPPSEPAADMPVQPVEPIPAPAAEPAAPPSEPEPAPPSPPAVPPDAPPATEPALPKTPAPEPPDAGTVRRTAPGNDFADGSPSPADLPEKSQPEEKAQDLLSDAPPDEPGEPQSDAFAEPFARPQPPGAERPPRPAKEGEERREEPRQFGAQGGFAYAEKSDPAAAKVRAFFVLRLVGSEFSTGDVAAGQSAARMAEQTESSIAAPPPTDAPPLTAPPPADAHQ